MKTDVNVIDVRMRLLQNLRDEADLCRNETADDIAILLDEAADEIMRLAPDKSYVEINRILNGEQMATEVPNVELTGTASRCPS